MTRKGWKAYKLNELGFVGRGKSKHRPRNEPSLYGGPYPFVQTADIMASEFYITRYTKTYSEQGLAQSKLWNPNTLCMTIAGENTAETAILTFSACFPDSIVGFIADPDKADVRFIKYYLDTIKGQIKQVTKGATQDNLSLDKLLSFDIFAPSLTIQRKIAGILSAYDDLIENNTRRIKILEEMARTIYREWFVEFRAPGVKLRKATPDEKKVTGKDVFPAGWELKSIGEAFETLGGGTPSTKNPEYWDNGDVTWFTPSDLTAAGAMFIGQSSKRITQLGLQKSHARLFPPYSVMMTSRATIGVTAINTKEACTNQGFVICIPNERVSAWQIYFWIQANKEEIISVASGATYKEINRSEFREFSIAVADSKTIARFVELVTPIAKQVENLIVKNTNLRRTRDLLLPRLVSGELDVENVEVRMSASRGETTELDV